MIYLSSHFVTVNQDVFDRQKAINTLKWFFLLLLTCHETCIRFAILSCVTYPFVNDSCVSFILDKYLTLHISISLLEILHIKHIISFKWAVWNLLSLSDINKHKIMHGLIQTFFIALCSVEFQFSYKKWISLLSKSRYGCS